MPRFSIILSLALLVFLFFFSPLVQASFGGKQPLAIYKDKIYGSATILGQTLMIPKHIQQNANTELLNQSSAELKIGQTPVDAKIKKAFLFWTGSYDLMPDRDADLILPGNKLHDDLTADHCYTNDNIGVNLGNFYYCRRDVTNLVSKLGPGGLNGRYTVGDVLALEGNCSLNPESCEAKYAAWSLVLVWESPTSTLRRDIIIYDGFLYMDEDDKSSGVPPPFIIDGFAAAENPRGEFTFFGLEGDRLLGTPPQDTYDPKHMLYCQTCYDYISFDGFKLYDAKNPPNNVWNSTVANGVDIDTFRIGNQGLNLLKKGQTSAVVLAGSGDGIVPDGNGELMFLGYMVLALDTLAPNFKRNGTQKIVDQQTAGIGDTLRYTILINNQGSAPATQVRIKDSIPKGAAYLTNSTRLDGKPIADISGQSPLATPGGLVVGDLDFQDKNQRIITFDVKIAKGATVGGKIINQALIECNELGPTSTNLVETVVAVPVLSAPQKIALDDNGPPWAPGDQITYQITLKNQSSVGVNNLTFTDDLPKYVKNLRVPPGNYLDRSQVSGGINSSGQVALENLNIPAKGQLVLTFQAQIYSVSELVAAGINSEDIDGLEIPNQGQISSPALPVALVTDDPATAAADDATTIALGYLADFSSSHKIFTDLDGNSSLHEPGDRIEYRIVVRNAGSRGENIRLEDHLPQGLEVPDPAKIKAPGKVTFKGPPAGRHGAGLIQVEQFYLDGNQEVAIVIPVRLAATLTDGSQIVNRAQLLAENNPTLNHEIESPVLKVTARPILASSSKSVSGDQGGLTVPGDLLTFTLLVENQGNRAATGVQIIDPLAEAFQVVDAGQGRLVQTGSGQQLIWDTNSGGGIGQKLSPLAPGAQVEIKFQVKVKSPLENGTRLHNQARITFDQMTKEITTNQVTLKVLSGPDFSSTFKTVTIEDLNQNHLTDPGDLAKYQIEVTNTGTATAAQVVINDQIDQSLTNVTLGSQGGVLLGNSIRWDSVSTPQLLSLAPTEKITLTFSAYIKTPLEDGTIINNQAMVESQEVTTPHPSDDPSTPAPDDPTSFIVQSAAVLTVFKEARDLNGGDLRPNDQVEYTITMENLGTGPARELQISDRISPHLTGVKTSPGGNLVGNTLNFKVPMLQVGDKIKLVYTAAISPAVVEGTAISNQAEITGLGFSGTMLSDDPATAAPRDPTVITVRKQAVLEAYKQVENLSLPGGGDIFRPLDNIKYTITLVNSGSLAAQDIFIQDLIPQSFLEDIVPSNPGLYTNGKVTWQKAELKAGQAIKYTIQAKIKAGVADETQVSNQALFTRNNSSQTLYSDDPATTLEGDPTLFTVTAKAELKPFYKEVKNLSRQDGTFQPSDQVEYTISITNNGLGLAENIVVSDQIDTAALEKIEVLDQGSFDQNKITWNPQNQPLLAKLLPGKSIKLKFKAQIKSSIDQSRWVKNQATAQFDKGPGQIVSDDPATPNLADDSTNFRIVVGPDLAFSFKLAQDNEGNSIDTVTPGQRFRYEITVTNQGLGQAKNIYVKDKLPKELEFVQADSGGKFDGQNTVTWDQNTTSQLKQLLPGKQVSLLLQVRATRPLDNGLVISNQASIGAENHPSTPSDNPGTPLQGDATRVTVLSAPKLKLFKGAIDLNGGMFEPGDQIKYQIVVINYGNMVAKNVFLSDKLDQNLTDIKVEQGTFDPSTRTASWQINSLGLNPSGNVNVTLLARIKKPLADGTVIANQAMLKYQNQKEIPSDDPNTPLSDDPTLISVYSQPNLSTSEKSVTDPNGPPVSPGDTLIYTILLRNNGGAAATQLEVEDKLSPLLQDAKVTSGQYNPNTQRISWSLPSLDSGQSTALTYSARIKQDAADGSIVENQAFIKSRETPAVPTDDPATTAMDDPTRVEVVAGPRFNTSIKLVQNLTADSKRGYALPGDLLQYTIYVENSGSVRANQVVLQDAIPVGTTYISGSTTLNKNTVEDIDGHSPLEEGMNINSYQKGIPAGVLTPKQPDSNQHLALITFQVIIDLQVRIGAIIANQGWISCKEGIRGVTDDPNTPIDGDPTELVVGGGPNLHAAIKQVELVEDKGKTGVAEVEDILEYRVTIYNSGTASAENVTLRDPIPENASYQKDSTYLNGVQKADRDVFFPGLDHQGSMVVNGGSLRPGKTMEVKFRVRVEAGPQISNQGIVSSDQFHDELTDADGNQANGNQPTVIQVGEGVETSLEVNKWVNDLNGGKIASGDKLLYIIQVKNPSQQELSNLTWRDSIPQLTNYLPQSLKSDSGEMKFLPLPAGNNGRGELRVEKVKIKAQGETQFSFLVVIDEDAQAGARISNQALVIDQPGNQFLSPPVEVTVGTMLGSASISGHIFHDMDYKGEKFDPQTDHGMQDFSLILVKRGQPCSSQSKIISDTGYGGSFLINDLPPGDYQACLYSRNAAGLVLFEPGLDNREDFQFSLPQGQALNQDFKVQASGMIYDSQKLSPIKGVEIFLKYVGNGGENNNLKSRLPADKLLEGQQGQVTGRHGLYKFNLEKLPGNFADYQIEVVPRTPLYNYPSTQYPPQEGHTVFHTENRVVREPWPTVTSAKRYYLIWRQSRGEESFYNNHIPLDQRKNFVTLYKRADRAEVSVGEIVTYTLTLTNNSGIDLLPEDDLDIQIHDRIPPGFRYIKLSSANNFYGAAVQHNPKRQRMQPEVVLDSENRFLLKFGYFALPSNSRIIIRYQLVPAGMLKKGKYTNQAVVKLENNREISPRVYNHIKYIPDPIFDQGFIFGKVFCDQNENSHQDSGERVVSFARIFIDSGYYAQVDSFGKFHFRGVPPGMHAVKIDKQSLLPNLGLTSDETRLVYISRGLPAKVNFGVKCNTQKSRADYYKPPPEPPLPPEKKKLQIKYQPKKGMVEIHDLAREKKYKLSMPKLFCQVNPKGFKWKTLKVPPGQAGLKIRKTAKPLDSKSILWQLLQPLEIQCRLQDQQKLLAATNRKNRSRWLLQVRNTKDKLIHQLKGQGPLPKKITWNGWHSRNFVLNPNRVYFLQMTFQSRRGKVISPLAPLATFALPPKKGVESIISLDHAFDQNSNKPLPRFKAQLQKLFATATFFKPVKITLTAHSDNRGKKVENLLKTQMMATRIKELLVQMGISKSEHITARGEGEQSPIAPNNSSRNRAKNRRLEIETTFPLQPEFLTPSMPESLSKQQPSLVITPVKTAKNIPGQKGKTLTPSKSDQAFSTSLPLTYQKIIINTKNHQGGATQLYFIPPPQKKKKSRIKNYNLPFIVEMVPDGAKVNLEYLPIRGHTSPKNQVSINGQTIKVEKNGDYSTQVKLKTGKNLIRLEVKDKAGYQGILERRVFYDPNRFFLLAMAEGAVAQSTANLDGFTTSSTYRYNLVDNKNYQQQLLLHGRGTFYLKAKVKPEQYFEDVDITAHFDSQKQRQQNFIEQIIDPERYFPVYGDASEEVEDVKAADKLFLKVAADDSTLLVGNYQADFSGDLVGYNRAFYGLKTDLSRNFAQHYHTHLKTFASHGQAGLAHRQVVLQGTGGSLYYLQDRNISQGSETVKLVVRHRDSGILLSARPLQKNMDYTFDYISGWLLLTNPLPSVDGSGALPGGGAAASGNPIFLEIDYDYRQQEGMEERSWGVQLRETLFKQLTLGTTYIADGNNGRKGGKNTIWGVDLKYQPFEETYLKAEFARSLANENQSLISTDGGLTYHHSRFNLSRHGTGIKLDRGNAFRLEMGGDVEELLAWYSPKKAKSKGKDKGKKQNFLKYHGYYHFQSPGFYSAATPMEQGQEKFGGMLHYFWGRHQFMLNHSGVWSKVPEQVVDATNPQGSRWLYRRLENQISTFKYLYKTDEMAAAFDYMHAFNRDNMIHGSRLSDAAAVRLDYIYNQDLKGYIKQEGVLQKDRVSHRSPWDQASTSLGLDYRLPDRLGDFLSLNLNEYLRWSGDNSTALGLKTKLEGSTFYVNQRFNRYLGQDSTTTVLGAQNDIPTNGLGQSSAYGEYEFEGGLQGKHSRMIMGMNNRWKITRGLFFNLFYERTQVTDQGKSTFNSFNPALYSATNSNLNPAIYSAANNDFLDEGSRDAVSFGVEYLAKDYIKAGGKYEFRYHNRDESKPQHFDYYQFTTLNTLGIQVSRDLTFLFRLNYAQTRNVTEKWDQAKNLETSVGLALRPVNYDWANLVAKYSRLISLRPISLENQLKQKSVSDIFTVMPVFELPMRLQLVEKVAIKLVQEQYEDLPGAKNVVVLWINRLNFHLTDFIDLGTEYRLLRQSWGSNIPMGELFKSKKGKSSIVESGFLFELAFLPVKYLSLGIGYNFTSFNDNEYQDVNRDASGMFFRMVGKY